MSLRKEKLSWVFIGLFLVVVAAAAYWVVLPQLRSQVTVRLGDGVFSSRIVDARQSSEMAQQDVDQLRADRAVMHVYSTDSLWTIDMEKRTALFDLVWLDKNKKVVHIVKNASTESQPVTVFGPTDEARYILEFRAGTVDKKAININAIASFDETHIKVGKP
jgi:uncharacterized membrane protein (UPF0127 family)